MFVINLCEIKFVNIEIKVLKKVTNKVFYKVKMKIHKGIGRFVRKNWKTRNKTKLYNTVPKRAAELLVA